jgi:uncharacterized protein YegL
MQQEDNMTDINDTTAPAAPGKVDFSKLDVAMAFDCSGTMAFKDIKNSPTMTRLAAVEESAYALASEMVQYDPDGLTVCRFAGKVRVYDNQTPDRVKQIFAESRPMGGTNTKEAIETLAKMLLDKQAAAGASANAICIICFTDGEPDDKVGLAQVIVDITKRIKDRSQIGILFVQVGNDPLAAAYLDKLNNDLTSAGALHDIVAVCKLEDLEDFSARELIESAFTD